MQQIKGFYSMPALANNSTGTVGVFGELSPYALTFSESKQDYDNPSVYPSTSLVVFQSVNVSNQTITVPNTIRDLILGVGQFLYNQHIAAAIPTQANAASFRTILDNEFPQFTDITIGEIVVGNVANQRMPTWVQMTYTSNGVTTNIKMWTSDQYFRNQYDLFKIYAIPPVANINTLNNSAPIVQNLVLQNTPNVLINSINNAKQFPSSVYTTIQTFQLTWNDPSNNGATLQTFWTLVIYGQAGIDTDVIKDAIRTYIDQNSNLTNWGNIYPDLYSENEFLIVPIWDRLATPDNAIDIGLFSASHRVGSLKDIATRSLPNGYAQTAAISTFLDSHLHVMATTYRSMSVLVLGNPNNQASMFSIDDLYPDYIAVPTTSPDFGRMEVETATFANQLVEALEKARIFSSTAPTPIGYLRVRRGNDYYLSFNLQGYNFIVLTRESFLGA